MHLIFTKMIFELVVKEYSAKAFKGKRTWKWSRRSQKATKVISAYTVEEVMYINTGNIQFATGLGT